MPKHSKMLNVDELNPVNDMAHRKHHSEHKSEHKKHHKRGGEHHVTQAVRDAYQQPQATAMPGSLHIIKDPNAHKRDGVHGIPGIINNTSLGNEQRQRLMLGIIEDPMGRKEHVGGAVHRVQGVDSTAYATGMVHIAGSPFRN